MQGRPLARAWAAPLLPSLAIEGVGGKEREGESAKNAELTAGFWEAGGEALL